MNFHRTFRMRLRRLLASAVAFLALWGTDSRTAEPLLEKTDLFKAGDGGYAAFRIPGLVVTSRGTMLAYCEGRAGKGDWTNQDILVRRSTDGGATWSAARVLVGLPAHQPRNPVREELKAELGPSQVDARTFHNCVMIPDRQTGAVHVVFGFDYWRVFYLQSNDDGRTFGEPREITDVVAGYRQKGYAWRVVGNGCGHGLQLTNGRLLVPLWLSDSSQVRGHGHRPSHAGVLLSDDHGVSWKIGDWVARNGEGIVTPNETCAVELADGRVMFNMRHESPPRFRAVTTSPDGATGWSEPKLDRALYDPICEASMIRVSQKPAGDRNRILFCNPDPRGAAVGEDDRPQPKDPRARRNLTLKLSYDEGTTWPVRKVLEPGVAGYSDLASASDGTLFCFFERGSTRQGDAFATAALTLARFNLAWLTEKKGKLEKREQEKGEQEKNEKQEKENNDSVGLPLVGQIRPRAAQQIASSTWSVGGETLDRDFAVYAHYRKFLGPLGAKAIRLQAGWAKCEKQPGAYDWAWLDEIVNDALAQGVQPWLETSYGNPIYEGGGGVGLGGGFPKSPQALAAWDAWVRALVRRYGNRVRQWEIWNEPDLSKGNSPEDYASLFIRTAEILRAEQPGARIDALALAGNLAFAEAFLKQVQERGKLDLVDAVTIHGYPKNPDDTSNVDKMRALLARYAPKVSVRQGETGAPSKRQEAFALSKLPWSETTQAKWDLRRMLAHRAKDVPFNLFTLMDMHYVSNGKLQMNYKGLLASNPDKTVAHAKPSYFAAQRVFAVFDDTVERRPEFSFLASAEGLAVSAYCQKESGRAIVAAWSNSGVPTESRETRAVDLTFPGVEFTEPVYADLLTGNVYAIPRQRWTCRGGQSQFRQMPLYDSPVLIAEKAALPLVEK